MNTDSIKTNKTKKHKCITSYSVQYEINQCIAGKHVILKCVVTKNADYLFR